MARRAGLEAGGTHRLWRASLQTPGGRNPISRQVQETQLLFLKRAWGGGSLRPCPPPPHRGVHSNKQQGRRKPVWKLLRNSPCSGLSCLERRHLTICRPHCSYREEPSGKRHPEIKGARAAEGVGLDGGPRVSGRTRLRQEV